MKAEAIIFGFITVFFLITTPIYFLMSHELAGSVALTLTFFLCLMITGYLGLTARKIDRRPEDRDEAEIVEGAGELGFFPPYSIWPFWAALTVVLIALGPVFGWWLMILGFAFGGFAVTGWIYQYYRGDHAH